MTKNINKYTTYTELPRHICSSTKVTTSCSGCNFVPKFDCIDCDLPKTTNHSSPDLVKRLRLFFLPALLLARNKPVMRTSKYKRFNGQMSRSRQNNNFVKFKVFLENVYTKTNFQFLSVSFYSIKANS